MARAAMLNDAENNTFIQQAKRDLERDEAFQRKCDVLKAEKNELEASIRELNARLAELREKLAANRKKVANLKK